jgi:hypothetical protein
LSFPFFLCYLLSFLFPLYFFRSLSFLSLLCLLSFRPSLSSCNNFQFMYNFSFDRKIHFQLMKYKDRASRPCL